MYEAMKIVAFVFFIGVVTTLFVAKFLIPKDEER